MYQVQTSSDRRTSLSTSLYIKQIFMVSSSGLRPKISSSKKCIISTVDPSPFCIIGAVNGSDVCGSIRRSS